ncbi:hypothetical protein BSKO_12272 [Bryopsis sp. KO-2023]|nr:hypothetical protein BSKO_12272 [Bryopsis sp. KO-2023]
MGFRIETKRYAATVALCLVLSATALASDALFDEICGDVSNDAGVRVFASPGTDIPKMKGKDVEKCKAMEWFIKFVEGGFNKGRSKSKKIKLDKKTGKLSVKKKTSSSQNDFIDCGNPDLAMTKLSGSIPNSRSACDITEEYLSFFGTNDGPVQKISLIWWPPPWWCVVTNGRRLMQTTAESVSIRSGGSSAEASFSSNADATSELSVSIEDSDGAVSVSRGSRNGVAFGVLPVAAVTICKGKCCVTSVVKGEMFDRLSAVTSTASCSGVGPSQGGTTSTARTATTSGASSNVNSNARSASSRSASASSSVKFSNLP